MVHGLYSRYIDDGLGVTPEAFRGHGMGVTNMAFSVILAS